MARTVMACPSCADGEVGFGPTARRATCDGCGTAYDVVDGQIEAARADFGGSGMSRRGWAGEQG